jgi:asparagine synthase (glutamine-hydrolysing)
LAFRRLSIIDVAGGRQPIENEDGSIRVVFNGEIYNFRELRGELEARGHRFRTRCDAEVIVHLYEELGAGCFARLSGMFAIAIWDARDGSLTLARDRFGKKPLTYLAHAGWLYFASEAKAILALPDVPRELEPQSLHRYLLLQYTPAPHSIYRGFRKLPPGHCVTFHAGQERGAAPRAYWRLPSPPPFAGRYADAKQRLGELLTRAVERRLIADVPLGAFLSGGVDSSIVVALMRRLGVSPLRTFSIGFDDPRYDETRHARRVAQLFETEHHEHVVTPDAAGVLDTLAWHYDEPFADSSAIPTYYVSKWARQRVTVALTGDAGDECFAGYDRYQAVRLAGRFDRIPGAARRALAAASSLLPRGRAKTRSQRAFRFLEALRDDGARRYLNWVCVFPPRMLRALYRPEFARQIDFDEPLEWFDGLHGPSEDAAAAANRADFASYLPFDLLTKVDIASMACSLECRSPFLDHELVEFALSLPMRWKLDGAGGKRILKDWARQLLPAEILDRPKMGFGAPVGEWFRNELRDPLRESLLAADGLCARILDRDRLATLLDEHAAGRVNHEHRLWALFMLERWGERWRG